MGQLAEGERTFHLCYATLSGFKNFLLSDLRASIVDLPDPLVEAAFGAEGPKCCIHLRSQGSVAIVVASGLFPTTCDANC